MTLYKARNKIRKIGRAKRLLRYSREVFVWIFCLALMSIIAWLVVPQIKTAYATVTNTGVVFFGDNSATNQGVLRAKTFTDPATWGSQIDGAAASSTSFNNWVVAKAAPTREEMTIGTLKANGTLDIQTCTTGCDTSGTDFTAQWNNPGTNATLSCNTTTAFGCVRPFDIGYLALSGKALVAYADNVANTFYYALWDGSSWTPNATPGTPGVSNNVITNSGGPACSGTPKWIRVIPAGDNLANDRSDRAMVLVADTNSALCAFYWDGTTFDTGTTITSTLSNCGLGQCFDGNWQGNNTFILNHTDTTVAAAVYYEKYTVGTGWGSKTQAYTTATAPIFVTSTADPTSSRIMITTVSTGKDTRDAVWRGDDATDGWTVCTGSCPDTSIEDIGGNQAYPAFERFNGDALHEYNDFGTTADPSYFTYTAPSTWSATTRNSITTTDDALMTKAWGSPNSDHIMNIAEDVDCKIYGNTWTGAAFNGTSTNLNNGTTATVTNYETAAVTSCPNANSPAAAPTGIAYAYDFVFKPYSPWQRNWQFYSGADTANTPTTTLAAQNTALTGFDAASGGFRLRMNYSERGNAVGNGTARKKLQFTSGCNPNTTLESDCTWTDVDQAGGSGIWRYKQVSTFTDNTLLAGTVLTGTNATCTAGNGCGTFVVDGTSAAGSNMSHNAGITQESEWDIEAHGAVGSTTYYFRIWDNQQATPIYRTQYASDCGAGAAQCTYPSITTATSGPTTDQILRGGEWFNSGVKQSFFWAN
jgi:hypothetical protein